MSTSTPATTVPDAGWYPDPSGAAPLRWWDGAGWVRATHDPAAEGEEWRTIPPSAVENPHTAPPETFPEFLAPVAMSAPTWTPPPPASLGLEPAPYPDLFDGPAQSDEQRRTSRRGLWLALGGLGLLMAVAIVAVVALLASARTSTLDTAAIETDISGRLSEEAGGVVTVLCPDSVSLSAGTTFTCDATGDDGSHVTIVVRQVDDQGNVTWKVGD